jgi:hypothetical protein
MGCFLKVIYFRDQKMREILRIFSKSTLHDTLCVAILKYFTHLTCVGACVALRCEVTVTLVYSSYPLLHKHCFSISSVLC